MSSTAIAKFLSSIAIAAFILGQEGREHERDQRLDRFCPTIGLAVEQRVLLERLVELWGADDRPL